MPGLDTLGDAPPTEQEEIPAWTGYGQGNLGRGPATEGGLGALDQAITAAQIRLEDAGRGIPRDRLLDEFRKRVLAWAPSHEGYRKARETQQAAAQEMMSYFQQPVMDDKEAWLRFATGALKPTRTGSFGEGLGNAVEGYTDVYSRARERYLNQKAKGAELGYQTAKDASMQEAQAMRDSLTGVGKIAALERVDQLMQKPGAMSDMEKKVRAMGFDPATPGGKRVMMQMIYMQHGSQEIKDTISEFPDITPGTPEFAEATKKRLGVKIGKAESATAASEAGTALARQRAENLEAELTQLRTRGQQIGPDPALAQQLGTTVSPTNPYAPLSGRAREDFYSKMQKQFDSENDDFREKAAKAQTFSQDGKRALALLAEPDPKAPGGFKPRITTGGVLALPGVSAVAGAFHPVYAELRAIQSRVAPSLRVVGSGATSDFDARMLQASTFGPDKPWPTNVALALGYIANAKRISDYQDAKERYFMANKHTQGFDQIWKKYANENPFLESSQEGLLIMRKGVPTFSEWLAKQPRAGQRPPVAPPTGESS